MLSIQPVAFSNRKLPLYSNKYNSVFLQDKITFGNKSTKKTNIMTVLALAITSALTPTTSAQAVKEPANISHQLPLFPKEISSSTVSTSDKLDLMAGQLKKHQLDAYYMPPEDEHLNLMSLPDNRQRILWLTGFDGQNTSLLVTPDKMNIYYPDLADQFDPVDESNIDKTLVNICKTGLKTPPDKEIGNAIAKMSEQTNPNRIFRVGYDPFTISPKRLNLIRSAFPPKAQIELVPVTGNIVDSVWEKRPDSSPVKAFLLDPELTGKTVPQKLSELRSDMQAMGADIFPLTKLDEIAWLFNVRGGDVPYRPVVESYAIITPDKAYWFAPETKISDKLKSELNSLGITVKPYEAYQTTLKDIVTSSSAKPKVLVDKDGITEGTLGLIKDHAELIEKPSPIIGKKIIKNAAEIQGLQFANYQASLALIKHLFETEKAFLAGTSLSEATLKEHLEKKYANEAEFHSISFPTIAAIGPNSYVGHHSNVDPDKKAEAGEFYMNDSGAQYTGGTTDTTRTIVFGQPSSEQIKHYTAVLQAHIACASARFPSGTTGEQLDAIGRVPLWEDGFDFEHSTGHGVGAFLNVHENPVNIGRQGKIAFQSGMVTSIEPSYYKKGWGGIRLENLYYATEDNHSANQSTEPTQKWYRFEHLTFVPFDRKLIDFSSLTDKEKSWLKSYYQKIWDKMAPALSGDEKSWLKEQLDLPFK